jgi:hypothetical protein
MTLVGALVPKVYDIDAQEQKFLMELVNKHEGRLRIRTSMGSRTIRIAFTSGFCRAIDRAYSVGFAPNYEIQTLEPTQAVAALFEVDFRRVSHCSKVILKRLESKTPMKRHTQCAQMGGIKISGL